METPKDFEDSPREDNFVLSSPDERGSGATGERAQGGEREMIEAAEEFSYRITSYNSANVDWQNEPENDEQIVFSADDAENEDQSSNKDDDMEGSDEEEVEDEPELSP